MSYFKVKYWYEIYTNVDVLCYEEIKFRCVIACLYGDRHTHLKEVATHFQYNITMETCWSTLVILFVAPTTDSST